ncbi:MAG: response regulator [Actinomycetes bacterium]
MSESWNAMRHEGPGEREPVRVLIVDDHEMFATSLRMALSHETDIDVVGTATTLGQAKNLLVTLEPEVVLLDHRLPDGLGVDSIGELTRLRPAVKVVVLTAAAEDSMLVTATEAGCAGFLLKTSPLEELVAAVRSAAAGEMLVSTELLSRLLNRLRADREEPAADLTARARDPAAHRRGADQRRDRAPAVHQRQHGAQPRAEPAGQARRALQARGALGGCARGPDHPAARTHDVTATQ